MGGKRWPAIGLSLLGIVGVLGNLQADPGFILLAAAALAASMIIAPGRVPTSRVLVGLLFTGWLVLVFLVLLTPLKRLPVLWVYLPFILMWPWLMAGMLAGGDASKPPVRRFFGRLARATAGVVIFFLFFEGLLQIAFNFLPSEIKYRMPQADIRFGIRFDTPHGAREYPAGQVVDYLVDGRGGDLYAFTCLDRPAEPPLEPYRVRFVRDAHGFRNPTPWPDDVDLVMVGDSFTAGEAVQSPFWQDLALSTLAFGLPDSGSLEQMLLLREFGLPRKPEVVVMAYFEGNDLVNTEIFARAYEAGENLYSYALPNRRPIEFLVSVRIPFWLATGFGDSTCAYPIQDSLGNELAFFDDFFTSATMDTGALRESALFAPTRSAILAAAAETQAQGASFVLVFLPYKAHAHWEALAPGQLDHVGRLAQTIDAQRQILAALAEEGDFLFLDLTGIFQAAVAAGEQPYFYGDTHWNQRGHDLAREALRDFLQAQGLLR